MSDPSWRGGYLVWAAPQIAVGRAAPDNSSITDEGGSPPPPACLARTFESRLLPAGQSATRGSITSRGREFVPAAARGRANRRLGVRQSEDFITRRRRAKREGR
ncbi:hypothetical protein MRX96_041416 [Rhipicephalus microplus]